MRSRGRERLDDFFQRIARCRLEAEPHIDDFLRADVTRLARRRLLLQVR